MGDHERELSTGCGKEATAATTIEMTPVGLTAEGAASGGVGLKATAIGGRAEHHGYNEHGFLEMTEFWAEGRFERAGCRGDRRRRGGARQLGFERRKVQKSRAGQKEIEYGLDGGDASE
ncbi:hypothetical protein M0R45_026051 [Rubus argutus]|uniref:Uncharacterized protein n=1 Tax=Rubus argutus TaxID=59490 RepID=A0AAW1WWF6_RUBAR